VNECWRRYNYIQVSFPLNPSMQAPTCVLYTVLLEDLSTWDTGIPDEPGPVRKPGTRASDASEKLSGLDS